MFRTPSIPQGIPAIPGFYARFDCFGRYLRQEDRATNGLGLVYKVQPDRSLVRVFGL